MSEIPEQFSMEMPEADAVTALHSEGFTTFARKPILRFDREIVVCWPPFATAGFTGAIHTLFVKGGTVDGRDVQELIGNRRSIAASIRGTE